MTFEKRESAETLFSKSSSQLNLYPESLPKRHKYINSKSLLCVLCFLCVLSIFVLFFLYESVAGNASSQYIKAVVASKLRLLQPAFQNTSARLSELLPSDFNKTFIWDINEQDISESYLEATSVQVDDSDNEDDETFIGFEAYSFQQQYNVSQTPFYKVISTVSKYAVKSTLPSSSKTCLAKVASTLTWSSLFKLLHPTDSSTSNAVELIYNTLQGWDDGAYLTINLNKPYMVLDDAVKKQREANIQNHLPIVRLQNAYVAENGRVFDCNGIGYELAAGCCRYAKAMNSLNGREIPSLNSKAYNIRKVDTAVVIAHSHSSTYYHALYESFPKVFWMLDTLQQQKNAVVVVGGTNSIIVSLLNSVGISSERIVVANSKSLVFAKSVYVPPHFITADHAAIVRRIRDMFRTRLGLFHSLYSNQCARFAYGSGDKDQMTFYNGSNVDLARTFANNSQSYITRKIMRDEPAPAPVPEFSGRAIVILNRPVKPQRSANYLGRTIANFDFFLEQLMRRFPNDHFVVFRGNQPNAFEAAIEQFRCAKLIVGVHGAGLGNIIFANPGTPLVDLTWDRQINNYVYETVTFNMFQPIYPVQIPGIHKSKPWNATMQDIAKIADVMEKALRASAVAGPYENVTAKISRMPVAHRYDREVLHPERHFTKGY